MSNSNQDNRNEWFLFKTPMVADSRDVNLLGVAFENPRQGTTGEYTPQGPRSNAKATDSTATPPRTPSPSALPKSLYMTPCKWPKDLVADGVDIYPNAPTSVSGAEAIAKRVQNTGLEAKIKSILAAKLDVDQDKLDKVIMPVLKRYQMESPRGKIRELLSNENYRSRLIDLCGQQSGKKRTLWIATTIITCEGVERNRENNDSTNVNGNIKDPTNHVPASVEAKWNRSNNLSSKGRYSDPIVLFMAYRRIRYEIIDPRPPRPWWNFWGGSDNSTDDELLKKGYNFPREDGRKDWFWIEDKDANGGDCRAFYGPESLKEEPGIFEHGDTLADAEEEQNVEGSRLPVGFFSDSEEDPVDEHQLQ